MATRKPREKARVEPTAPPLTPEQRELLVQTLDEWADRHPHASSGLIAFAGAEPLSPKELAHAVGEGTADGKRFLRMVQFGMEVASFDEIIQGLRSKLIRETEVVNG